MKKLDIKRPLKLKLEAIRVLRPLELAQAAGGRSHVEWCSGSCNSCQAETCVPRKTEA
jgi:hypothetical protein